MASQENLLGLVEEPTCQHTLLYPFACVVYCRQCKRVFDRPFKEFEELTDEQKACFVVDLKVRFSPQGKPRTGFKRRY